MGDLLIIGHAKNDLGNPGKTLRNQASCKLVLLKKFLLFQMVLSAVHGAFQWYVMKKGHDITADCGPFYFP